jgi:hypothetical protein
MLSFTQQIITEDIKIQLKGIIELMIKNVGSASVNLGFYELAPGEVYQITSPTGLVNKDFLSVKFVDTNDRKLFLHTIKDNNLK